MAGQAERGASPNYRPGTDHIRVSGVRVPPPASQKPLEARGFWFSWSVEASPKGYRMGTEFYAPVTAERRWMRRLVDMLTRAAPGA